MTIAGALLLSFLTPGCATPPGGGTYEQLLDEFRNPPAQARPDAFWPWLNGHADPERITAEMEAFQAAGFSCLQIWDMKAHQDPEGLIPVGPAFLSDEWLEILAHANRDELLRERGLLLAAEAGGPGPPIWNSCPVEALGAVGLMRGAPAEAQLSPGATAAGCRTLVIPGPAMASRPIQGVDACLQPMPCAMKFRIHPKHRVSVVTPGEAPKWGMKAVATMASEY